jgi:hypothetical protein
MLAAISIHPWIEKAPHCELVSSFCRTSAAGWDTDFLAVDRNLARSTDTQADSVSGDFEDHQANLISDQQFLERISAENEHGLPFLLM